MSRRAHAYTHAVALVLAAAALALASPRAQAEFFTLSGTFSATVQADPLPLGFTPPHPDSYYDGAAVAGSFQIALVDPALSTGGADHAYFVDPAGQLKLDYKVRGETFSYIAAGGPVILLERASGDATSLTLLTDFVPKYSGGSVTFAGTGLFSDLDIRTISFGGGKPLFGTEFADPRAAMHFALDVTRATFGPATPIPEPSTLALTLSGALAVAWRTRRGHVAPS